MPNDYPGEFIPTVLIHRSDGTQIYVSSREYHSNPKGGTFAEKYDPVLERPEVCRKYRSVQVRKRQYRLEEIS